MKRGFVLFGLIFLLIFIGFVSAECTDSDGGENYEVKGTAVGVDFYSGNFGEFTDYCYTASDGRPVLVEYSCYEKVSGGVFVDSIGIICSGECIDGACDMVSGEIYVEPVSVSASIGYCDGELSCNIFESKIQCELAVNMVNNFEEEVNNSGFFSNQGLCVWDEEASTCIGKTSCVALNILKEEGMAHEDFCNEQGAIYGCKWTEQSAKSFWDKFVDWLKRLFRINN